MKKISLTLCSLLLAVSANAKSMVPEKFKNYRTTYKNKSAEIKNAGNKLYLVTHYDMDGDNMSDISEYKPCKNINGRIWVSPHPTFYYFDINGDKQYSDYELLMDKEVDGLNGNEEWAKKRLET